MREFINRHGKVIAPVLLVVAVIVGFLLARRSPPTARENPSFGFFVDERTGEESIHPVTDLPPLQGKSGHPTVVRVFKFTCDNGKTVQVGYYMKYPENVRAALSSMAEDDFRRNDIVENARLVRLPATDSPWIKVQSEEGEKILKGPACSSGTQRMVHPEM